MLLVCILCVLVYGPLWSESNKKKIKYTMHAPELCTLTEKISKSMNSDYDSNENMLCTGDAGIPTLKNHTSLSTQLQRIGCDINAINA